MDGASPCELRLFPNAVLTEASDKEAVETSKCKRPWQALGRTILPFLLSL
jgi:hypothetical protein